MRHITQLAMFIAFVATAPTVCADVIYVSQSVAAPSDGSSWTTAFKNLQDAIAIAVPGDQIWVAQGTYRPDLGAGQSIGDRAAWFLLPIDVSIFGGFMGTESSPEDRGDPFERTILSGDLASNDLPNFLNRDDNSYHVLRAAGATPATILDGFCVMGGNALDDPFLSQGAGMLSSDSSQTIRNCTFEQNQANGGGAILLQSGGVVTFSDCEFEDNEAKFSGGGAIKTSNSINLSVVRCAFRNNQGGQPLGFESKGGAINIGGLMPWSLKDSIFEDNSSNTGGAVYAIGSGSVTRCTFRNNSSFSDGGALSTSQIPIGDGVEIVDSTFISNSAAFSGGALVVPKCTAINSTFIGNSAPKGGAVNSQFFADVSFSGCKFFGNTASEFGGAVYQSIGLLPKQSILNIDSCSLVANSAGTSAGGIYLNGVEARIENSILWRNTDSLGQLEAAQVQSSSAGTLAVDFSLVEGLTGALGGIGNISLNPQFVDADGPDNIAGTEDDDLRLKRNSPGLDAGNRFLLPTDALDLDHDGDDLEPLPLAPSGVPRVLDSNGDGLAEVDMGAEEFATLTVDIGFLSTSIGGKARFTLEAGLPNSQSTYWVLGSSSGTSPGVDLSNGLVLPLNFDAYTKLTRTQPTAPIFSGSFFGALDANGSGRATLALPPIAPSLAGLELSHAFLTVDSFGSPKFSSNAVTLLLIP